MKSNKLLLAALGITSLIFSAPSFSQNNGRSGVQVNGSVNVPLPELDANFRIEIGNPRRLNSEKRMERMEAAIADMQHRMYRMEDRRGEPVRGKWVCIVTSTSRFTPDAYKGEATTKIEAASKAKNACIAAQSWATDCNAAAVCEQE